MTLQEIYLQQTELFLATLEIKDKPNWFKIVPAHVLNQKDYRELMEQTQSPDTEQVYVQLKVINPNQSAVEYFINIHMPLWAVGKTRRLTEYLVEIIHLLPNIDNLYTRVVVNTNGSQFKWPNQVWSGKIVGRS
jgi:hypothetical protein